MGNCDTIHPRCISVQKLVTGLCTYQISPQAHLWKDEVTVRALGCQLPLDHSNIVAAVVLLPVTACKPGLSPPPPVSALTYNSGWQNVRETKLKSICLGRQSPLHPTDRTDNIVLMNPFHLETQGQGNRITSLIPVSFAKLSHFSLFPFAILLFQAKIPRATDTLLSLPLSLPA